MANKIPLCTNTKTHSPRHNQDCHFEKKTKLISVLLCFLFEQKHAFGKQKRVLIKYDFIMANDVKW